MNKRIYIAGAHSRAATLGHYLTYLDQDIKIIAYLYDNDEDNPKTVNGIPVIKINEDTILETDCKIYLGTRGINHPHLIETLKACGMKEIIPVDVALDMEIRNKYLMKYYADCGRDFCKLDDMNSIGEVDENKQRASLFVISSVFDKPLNNPYHLNEYEKTIQVGASLTDKEIDADYLDNLGDNISDKNKQFCELTGLYWIWKHAKEDIVGLEHYRRHFILPDDWVNRMINNGVDVILPVPLYVVPNLEGNYRARHEEEYWDYMLEYVKEQYPREYGKLSLFFKETSLYSPCNMFIMKREILNELCSWMFPILFAVAERGGVIEDSYQNRYPGFMSERLISYFFEKNRDRYNVVYSDKNFLE